MIIESKEFANHFITISTQVPSDINDEKPIIIAYQDSDTVFTDKSWTSITIMEELYQNMREELIMNDYPRVQFICIGTSSFGNVPSLTISNLPELRVISTKSESFKKTTSVTLSSIF